MPKNPQPIPAISTQQMEWVIAESGISQDEFRKMIRELGANPHNYESIELAQGLCEAARGGLPRLGAEGQAFIDMVKSWEPWLWEAKAE